MPCHVVDPKLAILQTTNFFRSTSQQTWTEQDAGVVVKSIFRILQPCRDKQSAVICVGSNAVYCRAALEPIGGIVPASDTEDIHPEIYVTSHRWTLKNMPLNLACGVCHNTPRAVFLLPSRDLWKSDLFDQQKMCYRIRFAYFATTAVQPFLGPIPAQLILLSHPELLKYYNLFFAFSSLLLTLVTTRIWTRGRYTLSVQYMQIIMS
ncbi:MAG: hypothetical protein Q9195_003271 [Heterodermia aff. obscurata]